MPRTIFLHIGKHKTGTGSIQQYLETSAGYFAGHGFGIVRESLFTKNMDHEYPDTNNVFLAHLCLRRELMTPIRYLNKVADMDHATQCRKARLANAALHDQAGRALLISAEAFSFLRTKEERAVLDSVFEGFDIYPIIALRETQSWLESWRQQMLHLHHRFAGDGAGEATIFDYAPQSWLTDDRAILDFWGQKARVISYEDALQAHGNIIPAYLRAIGLDPADAPEWTKVWQNKTHAR